MRLTGALSAGITDIKEYLAAIPKPDIYHILYRTAQYTIPAAVVFRYTILYFNKENYP